LTAEEAALYRALSQSIYKTHNKWVTKKNLDISPLLFLM
jgi:hypothetical protein